MFKHFVWLAVFALVAAACNSYDVEGNPEIVATPPNWSVDYILRTADLKDNEKTWQEFVISNKAETGELQIFAINLLTPDGHIIGSYGVDPDISRLFSFEYSNVTQGRNGGITNILVDDSNNPQLDAEGNYQVTGYTLVEDGQGQPVFSFDNYSNATNAFQIAPLCPLKDPLHPTAYSYTKTKENTTTCRQVPGDPNRCINECQRGYEASSYNRFIKIKVNYKQLENAIYKDMLQRNLPDKGNFAVEFCTNDPSKDTTSPTCAEGTSFKVPIYRYPNLPPQPFIGLQYTMPISGYKDYRVIKDPVNMDVHLTCPRRDDIDAATVEKCEKTLVSDVASSETMSPTDFVNTCCLPNWQDFYCIKYRWELVETPTPLAEETRISLDNIIDGGEGMWYSACGDEDPTLASFRAHMITPVRKNGKEIYYKVKISAVTVDKQTDLESDITDKIDAPNIIPAARVMVQLTWKEGLPTAAALDRREGVAVDVDLHLIKKKGMDACGTEVGADGLMCTSMGTSLLTPSPTHDDCHFNDLGNNGKYQWTGCSGDFKTIAWHASLDLDNTWGGADYTSPETINLGPIEDSDKDGKPDVNPYSDDYLVVVNYNRCQNLKDEDQSACQPGGSHYAVHGRVEIFVDGDLAPREGDNQGNADENPLNRIDFVINPQEWIVLDLITWNQSLPARKNTLWQGDAIVKNQPSYLDKVCKFDLAYCHDTPIWGEGTFETWVTNTDNTVDGTCYAYDGQ